MRKTIPLPSGDTAHVEIEVAPIPVPPPSTSITRDPGRKDSASPVVVS